MSPTLDTPARAARSSRPKTRAWKKLISEADRDSENASKIRAQLRKHLDAADRLALRRAKRGSIALECPYTTQVNSSPPDTLEASSVNDCHFEVIKSRDPNWEVRLAVMKEFRDNPINVSRMVEGLALQLTDLRSQIVVAAADAIEAAKNEYEAADARILFDAAISGVSDAKKVMADARERAGFSAVSAQLDCHLWSHIVSCISTAIHEKGRKLGVNAVTRFLVPSSCEGRADLILKALSLSAVDKSPIVRKAARELMDAFEKHAGESSAKQIISSLSREAKSRLELQSSQGLGSTYGQKTSGTLAGKPRPRAGAPSARPAGKLSMKEMIRIRREEMKQQRGAGKVDVPVPMVVEIANKIESMEFQTLDCNQDKDNNDGKKRDSADRMLNGRKDGRKKRALISKEKENCPASSVV